MTKTLEALSTAIADGVESASRAVVRVDGRRRISATGIAWGEEGLILTANHVVKREEGVRVGFESGETLHAEVLGRDPTTDLALLKVDTKIEDLPRWADSDSLRVGHIVLALGRPGANIQATLGVTSAVGSPWRTPTGGELKRYIQTDVVMYPGFSGGPLINAGGEYVGLNSSALVRGVSITIPNESLFLVAQDLVNYGQVRRGYLGVSLQIVKLSESLATELGQKTGLLIAGIEPSSPAARGGLYQGDILVATSESPLRHMDDLFVQLRGENIGSNMAFRVVRAGQLHNVEVEIVEREGK
jgi:S1-C subfamily serine protease